MRHVHNAGIKRYVETSKRHISWEHIEVPALHRDGNEFPHEISFGDFSKNGRHNFIGIARDVSERKRTELERERLLQREQEARLQAEDANRIKTIFSPRSRTNYEHRSMRFSDGRKCCRHIISAKATRKKH